MEDPAREGLLNFLVWVGVFLLCVALTAIMAVPTSLEELAIAIAIATAITAVSYIAVEVERWWEK
ncbi:hypothetical protein OU415_09450 [Saccharopolyspora sp. WRP15-2]|uniref:DUF2530 domain-containing protein n=1 Tax=Saccharopolyspora oryzae TaxID=2997343 RepID=A0ABT4UVB1_9PSEU|nr:hypothetical protein [Saccharopolyspora oryzae]MDA3625660.1 hypothetical protein [Saccharopolyspora oryzae]